MTEKFTIYTETLWHLTADLGTVYDDLGGYLFLKSADMCWSTLALDGHTGILQNFKNIKLTDGMVIRVTVVCKIPYTLLKCSSLNPCLNLQKVKNTYF